MVQSDTMDRSDVIAQFVSLTNGSDAEAAFYLEAAHYDLDRAVAMFYDQAPSGLQHRASASAASRLPEATAPPQAATHRPRRQRPGLFQRMVRLPLLAVGASVRIVTEIVRFGYACTTAVGSRVLPHSIVSALQGATQALLRGNRYEDPPQSAASFKQLMQQRYGLQCPDFQETSWQDAAIQAHRQFKFLFVYLHSPDHEDADRFCQQTLCNPEFVHYVNSTFLCWGGDVHKSDPFMFSSQLHVAHYPYIALLSGSGQRTRKVASCEGFASPSELMQTLQPAVEEHGAQFVADQADHNERQLNRRLREEQDAEYQRSLLADQEREKQQAAERAAQQQQQRAAQQAQDAERAEKEAAEKKRTDRATALQQRRANKRVLLPAEPPVGTPSTAAIRIRLPDGSSAQRRFSSDQPLQAVYDFVDSLEGLQSLSYSLATTFPKVIYSSDKLQQTIQQLGLAPQAAMLVQNHDDD